MEAIPDPTRPRESHALRQFYLYYPQTELLHDPERLSAMGQIGVIFFCILARTIHDITLDCPPGALMVDDDSPFSVL